ncbi:MAG: hypothetical protein V5A64_06520 [Candidatus Thermoplasmatota archaeon]
MSAKAEGKKDLFPRWLPEFSIEEGGDGFFVILQQTIDSKYEKKIKKHFEKYFKDVSWCPDPDSHGKEAIAVLNCFYPKFKE